MSARFQVGDPVRTRATVAAGHTRLPRYLAGHVGRIARVHGGYPRADARARGESPPAQTLYCVVFDGREIWGDEIAGPLSIAADLWDDYLEAEES